MVSAPWFELASPISRLIHERGGLRCPVREEDHPIQELRCFSHPTCVAWRERVGCREVKGVGPPGVPHNSSTYVGDRRFPKSPLSWLYLRKDMACVPVGCRSLCIQQSPPRFRQTNALSLHSYFPILTVMPRPWRGPQPPKGGERLRSLEATSDSEMLRC